LQPSARAAPGAAIADSATGAAHNAIRSMSLAPRPTIAPPLSTLNRFADHSRGLARRLLGYYYIVRGTSVKRGRDVRPDNHNDVVK
jgi:hypothetical protein